MRAWFRERIVGQERAIDAVVEAIALFKAGLHDPTKPIGTFLFVGPTGVGKTELARATAAYLFGSPHRLLRFDLSEYKDYHAFETLVGNPRDPDSPARLIDPVRAQPFQVVLLDELEKAHPNVWDLLLPLLDEGHLTSGAGRRTDFRNTLVIATSNVGAAASTRALGFDRQVDAGASIRKALEAEFRPELINRFQHVVVFHALTAEQVRAIARHELAQILRREGIARRNLVVDVDDGALDLVIERGYDPKYGARALKRELQRGVVLPLAMTLMEREVAPGSLLRVSPRDGQIQVRVIDTAESRKNKREQAPIPVGDGRKVGRDELRRDVEAARERVEALAKAMDEAFLRVERDRLVALRGEPDFWRDAAAAARDVRDLDTLTVALDRLDRLRARGEALSQALGQADTRTRLVHAGNDLARLVADTAVAWRELVVMKDGGHWDALVEVRPIGGRMARDLLVETYTRWAAAQQMTVEWLFEPRGDLEPAMFAVQGRYPHGLLRGEAGVHRVRRGEDHDAARVRVAPWTDVRGEVRFGEGRAVKAAGAYGGTLRSRLACGAGFVLQNARTLAENRALALDVAPSWSAAPPASEAVVRRYDLEPLLVRDVLTDETTGRTDALQPEPFHALLCRRVDALAGR
jgi:ATP-dependent Clp protease ATP-binding subunit ClpC